MALESLKAQIALLVTEMENTPRDAHEIYAMIHEKLNEIRAMGLPLPEDLVALEENLESEFDRRPKRPDPAPGKV